jgi:hypothetical protein
MLLGVASYNLRDRIAEHEAAVGVHAADQESLRATVEDNDKLARVIGQTLKWPVGVQRLGTEPRPRQIGYEVIAILNGLECSTSRSLTTALLRRIQFELPPRPGEGPPAQAVVLARDIRTAQSYSVANKFSFPIYLDDAKTILRLNNIPVDPVILVTDAKGVIVQAFSATSAGRALWLGHVQAMINLLTSNQKEIVGP